MAKKQVDPEPISGIQKELSAPWEVLDVGMSAEGLMRRPDPYFFNEDLYSIDPNNCSGTRWPT